MKGKTPVHPVVDEATLVHSIDELFEYGPCGYLAMLPNGTIALTNHTFLSWIGYTREALLGKHWQDLLTVPGKIFFNTHVEPLLRMQGTANEIAFELVRSDGSRLPILFNSSLRRADNGEPQLIIAAIFDATDRRNYEQELLWARREAERASRIKADLLSMISHDFRTPASAIGMAVELLDKTDPSPQQQKALRILKSATGNLLSLLNEVLDFSSLEGGNVARDDRPTKIREFLENLRLTVLPEADAKGLALRLEVAADVPAEVDVDAPKLGQVITNLLTNAVKFTEYGEVRLSVRTLGLQADADRIGLRFSVHDTGIGIPPDRQPYIFDEFTQASGDIAKKYGGTGLGLTISRKLLGLYNSDIEVTSREGEGSTFAFNLRLAIPGETP